MWLRVARVRGRPGRALAARPVLALALAPVRRLTTPRRQHTQEMDEGAEDEYEPYVDDAFVYEDVFAGRRPVALSDRLVRPRVTAQSEDETRDLIEALQRAQDATVPPEAHEELTRLCEQGDLVAATALVCSPHGPSWTLLDYAKLISSSVSADKMVLAEHVWGVAVEHGVVPTEAQWVLMVHGYAQRGDVRRVEQLDEAATALGIVLGPEALGSLTHAYAHGYELALATDAYRRLKELAHKGSHSKAALRDALHTALSAVLDLLCLQGLESDAWSLLLGAHRTGVHVDPSAYVRVLEACVRPRNHSLATTIVQQMLDRGFAVPTTAYNALLAALVRAGLTKEAQRRLVRMEEPDERSFGLVMSGAVKERDVPTVERLFLAMRTRGLQGEPQTWRYVIEALLRSKQAEKAFLLVDQMLHEGVTVSNALRNILRTHSARKGPVARQLYEERFGALHVVPDSRVSARRRLEGEGRSLPPSAWDELPAHALPLAAEARRQFTLEEEAHAQRLRELEEHVLASSLAPDHVELMRINQAALAQQRRQQRTVVDLTSVLEEGRRAERPVKATTPPPRGEEGIDVRRLRRPLKAKHKTRTTSKDTRRPREQFPTHAVYGR